MRQQKKLAVAATQIAELFPKEDPGKRNPAAELLQSRVIEAFETAIQQGMGPYSAMGVILEWASTELNRFCAGGTGQR